MRVFQLERATFIYWSIECTPRTCFVRMFQLERPTFMYWPVECILKVWFVKMSQDNYLHLLAYGMHSKAWFVMVFQLERIIFIYWPIECTPKVLFVRVFQFERTTIIYWPIECTLKAWFEWVLRVEKITIIYWSIEYILKIWFVMVLQLEKTTFMYWPIECTPKTWFEWVSELKKWCHLFVNWMHSKNLICQGVTTWKKLISFIDQLNALQFFIYKTSTTWKHHPKNTLIYGRIECTQRFSFVMVFQFEITSFTYWSLSALENFDLCECFNLQELFTCTLAN